MYLHTLTLRGLKTEKMTFEEYSFENAVWALSFLWISNLKDVKDMLLKGLN
jgi:hypothetical protein